MTRAGRIATVRPERRPAGRAAGSPRDRQAPAAAAAVLLLAAVLIAGARPGAAAAAILDPLRAFGDEPGWSGSVEGSYSATGGNTEVSSLEGAARVQLLGARHRWRLLGAVDRQTSRGELTARSVSAHLRHNLRLDARLATLSFLQWQENPFQRLQARYLVGAGLRADLAGGWPAVADQEGEEDGGWRLAVGAADMLEIERRQGRDAETRHRLSTFVDLQGRPGPRVLLQGTVFLQPRWSEPADYRLLASGGLRVTLVGALAQFTRVRWERDSRPPPGVERDDWRVVTGLSLDL